MSNQAHTVGIVRPETVAQKLAAIRNYEHPELLAQITETPRLVELLWFLQFMSMQPGGLTKFAQEMIEAQPQRVGTRTMRDAGNKAYSLEQKLAIRGEIASPYAPDLPIQESALAEVLWDSNPEEVAHMKAREQRALQEAVAPFDAAFFLAICRKAAAELLPAYLHALCSETGKSFGSDANTEHSDTLLVAEQDHVFRRATGWRRQREVWYMDDPISAVLEMMDLRAAAVQQRLASTAISKLVFDALDYSLQERAMVRVEGDSRFGKTESVRAWCDMRPGLARLVSVPSSNSLADLHRRIADSLGMDVSYGSRTGRLKERIEYVLQHSGLFLVLDEAAFLVPQNYTAQTAPARLNWVRTEIVDRGLPVAVVVTPQSFLPAVQRFVKKTGYAMEQFFGRNYRNVQLPAELDEEDMIAVARIHFPELGDDYLALIADLARVSENYLQAVEAIAKLARYIARREKHRRITVADIEAAASEIIPRRVTVQPAEIAEPSEPRGRASRNTDSSANKRRFNAPLNAPARGLQPATERPGAEVDLQSCSLRGAGPARVDSEPVSAEA